MHLVDLNFALDVVVGTSTHKKPALNINCNAILGSMNDRNRNYQKMSIAFVASVSSLSLFHS